MIKTTTNTINGHPIRSYLGAIAGEAIMGANVFNDVFVGVRDIVGDRSGAYETEIRTAQDLAMADLEAEAVELGANAIVGLDLDVETISGSMLMVIASGTAVPID